MSYAAKAFSISPGTRRAYRKYGNEFESWRRGRQGLSVRYVDRARLITSFVERYVDLPPGSEVLEIGTGYVHWSALILKLMADVNATLFDVVDNRFLDVFKMYAAELAPQLETLGLPSNRLEEARSILASLSDASSFDEVYADLSWKYIIDEAGTMAGLPADSFDFVVSSDVLEHIDRDIVGSFVDQMFRLVKPGGLVLHAIDLCDHLSYFDPKAPAKAYCRFDGPTWDRWFNSKTQYINRIQRPQWLSLFERAGFECVAEEPVSDLEWRRRPIKDPLGITRVHRSYADLTQLDLQTTTLVVVLRKPKVLKT